jgi:hypothetical protein
MGKLPPRCRGGRAGGGVLVVTVAWGWWNRCWRGFAFRRVPLLLTTAFLLCLFALLVAWKGGAGVNDA